MSVVKWGTATTAYNAANEVAVARFLRKEISFLKIEDIIASVLEAHRNVEQPELEQIAACDQDSRKLASML